MQCSRARAGGFSAAGAALHFPTVLFLLPTGNQNRQCRSALRPPPAHRRARGRLLRAGLKRPGAHSTRPRGETLDPRAGRRPTAAAPGSGSSKKPHSGGRKRPRPKAQSQRARCGRGPRGTGRGVSVNGVRFEAHALKTCFSFGPVLGTGGRAGLISIARDENGGKNAGAAARGGRGPRPRRGANLTLLGPRGRRSTVGCGPARRC